ncbi:hypothetical protein AYO40_05940 [Planctomycetaceae bacterium SCGC AG-212-D15]|nr:hypothetical protein AYO40_05940 [Planctomycetaceae bacterium SCGC AG-212-D15]
MTDLLAELHYSYGLLAISLTTMDEARAKWAGAISPAPTEEELLRVPFAEDEPVVLVRIAKNTGEQFRRAGAADLALLASDPRGNSKERPRP